MRVIERIIEYSSRSDVFTIHPLSDIHLGSAACDEKRLDRRLREIDQDSNALWLLLGDQCDFINYHDPRFDIASLPKWLVMRWYEAEKVPLGQLQADELAQRINGYETLGDKLLCAAEGNHERMLRLKGETDAYLSLLNQIRTGRERPLALGMSGFVLLRFRRVTGKGRSKGSTFTVVLYVHHGWGGGRLAGGVNLKLERLMKDYDADVFLMGHHHKITTHTTPGQFAPTASLEIERHPDKVGAICGTFMRGRIDQRDTYSEAQGYPDSPLASIVLKVAPDKKEIQLVERSRRETVSIGV